MWENETNRSSHFFYQEEPFWAPYFIYADTLTRLSTRVSRLRIWRKLLILRKLVLHIQGVKRGGALVQSGEPSWARPLSCQQCWGDHHNDDSYNYHFFMRMIIGPCQQWWWSTRMIYSGDGGEGGLETNPWHQPEGGDSQLFMHHPFNKHNKHILAIISVVKHKLLASVAALVWNILIERIFHNECEATFVANLRTF